MTEPEMQRYGTVSRLFHWTVAVLVFVQIPMGVAMTSYGFEEWRDALFIGHKGLGVILLVLVLLRLVWRVFHTPPPPPPHWPPIQRVLARTTHATLYALLVVMGVTGYLRTVGGGFPIELLDMLGVPPLVSDLGDTADTLSVVHKFTAYLLVGLIGVHMAAALHSAWIEKDGVMERMWPPVGGGKG